MKKRINKPALLIFISFMLGISFILYPQLGDVITQFTASSTIKKYEKTVQHMTDPTAEELMKQAISYNQALYQGKAEKEEETCINMEDGVMCYLDIPKIHVYLPVYYGTSSDVLEKGCGYLENTSLPVGGTSTHSVISGHTGLPGAELLSSLSQLTTGDVFYIHVLDEVHAYQVDQKKSVLPEETGDLKIVPGKDYITLLTCTPYGVNDHRLLVRGSRIAYEEDAKTDGHTIPEHIQKAWNTHVIMIAAEVGITAAVILLAKRHLRKVRDENEKKHTDHHD